MRPQVFAHRGGSEDTVEHTLRAYTRAIEAGVDGLECDVRLTADGHLVCVHDRNLRRTASTRGVVSTMNLAELDELDFARWKNPWAELDEDAPVVDPAEGKVLTLRRLLETVAAADRPIELAIETKHPTRYAGLVERRVVELLADFGWESAGSPVRVMSFSLTALQRMRRLAPGLAAVMLIERAHNWPMLRRMVGEDWMIGPDIQLLREHPWLGKDLLRSGRELNVWTVNTEDELRLCQDLGVTAVISDRPAHLIGLLDA